MCSKAGRKRGQRALVCTRWRQGVRELVLETLGERLGEGLGPLGLLYISSFQACTSESVYGGEAVHDVGAAGLHFLPEVAGKGPPGKGGEGRRLVGSGGTGVVPKWAFWELVKALLRLTLWL